MPAVKKDGRREPFNAHFTRADLRLKDGPIEGRLLDSLERSE
jgi:hypothetical protein